MAVVVTAVVVVGASITGAIWVQQRNAASANGPTHVPVATAVVQRTTLSSSTQLSGDLGHGLGTPVYGGQPGGTLTALPAPSTVVARGGSLFEVDGVPVTLMYGNRPLWRDLAVGVTPAPDVLELEQNLVALGYANGLDLSVDDVFTSVTREAVERWQAATGQAVTGIVARGSIVFEAGPVRVQSGHVDVGGPISPGSPVLTVDSAVVSVVAQVPTSQTYLVHTGDRVTVTLPSGTPLGGAIQTVSAVASAGDSGSGNQGPAQVMVPVTIKLDDPTSTDGLDQAPVTVDVTDKTVHNVLAVPITALVALAGGGYGVYVVHGSAHTLVGVAPGLFASTLVQVTSSSLRAGDAVQVPAS